jgi:hypothetical protein
MSKFRMKPAAFVACGIVAGALIASNAWSSSGVTYNSRMSQLFSNSLGEFGYDTGVRSIQLVCNAPGALVDAHITVQSGLSSFTKVIEGTNECSEAGVLVNATSYGRRGYWVESRQEYADAMVLGEWRHALDAVFGSLAYTPEGSMAVNGGYARNFLLAEEVNDVEFSCGADTNVYHYVAKAKGARLEGDTAISCRSNFERGRIVAFLTRGSERLAMSNDIRDGLISNGLTDEYRVLTAQEVSVKDVAELADALQQVVRTRHSF